MKCFGHGRTTDLEICAEMFKMTLRKLNQNVGCVRKEEEAMARVLSRK